jgi:hypothetical protein
MRWGRKRRKLRVFPTLLGRIPYPTARGLILAESKNGPPDIGVGINSFLGQKSEFSPIRAVFPQKFASYPQEGVVCAFLREFGVPLDMGWVLSLLWADVPYP